MITIRRVFMIDAIGAMLSALLSGLVLPRISDLTGIPHGTLYVLTTLAIIFAAYSAYICLIAKSVIRSMLLLIINFNLLYCLLSIYLIFTIETLSPLGQFILIAEIIAILGVVAFEIFQYRKFAKHLIV